MERQATLFNTNKKTPLATIIRPKNLDEIIGQDKLLGTHGRLRGLILSDKLTSIILFGPPGTGKTTIASVIADTTKSKFIKLNATQASVKDIRKYGEEAVSSNSSTIIFVDECHRFSKTQTDALLPYTEYGHLIFIGATTENPYHSMGPALVSRMQMLCELEPLKRADLARLIKRGMDHLKKSHEIKAERDAMEYIINAANGDGRKAISTLELCAESSHHISLDVVKSILPRKNLVLSTQSHFDFASACQGSIQASDPDAAIYWLAKWLESGEDPRYIARRIMVSASEDACSSPNAAVAAHNAYIAACEIGRPECDIVLAHAVTAIASSPRDKSAAEAIWSAVKDVRHGENIEVPVQMRDSHYPGAKHLGHGSYHDGANPSQYVGINKRYYNPDKWVEVPRR